MRRSSRLIEIGAGLREQGRRPLVVMATDGSAFVLESWQRIRSVLSVRSAGLSSWRPTSTTSGRTRGILSSCGTKTTFSRSATSVTLERRQERMEALGTMCSRKKIMGRMLVVVERAEFVWNSARDETELIVWAKSKVDGFVASVGGVELEFTNEQRVRVVNGELLNAFKAIDPSADQRCSGLHRFPSLPVCLVGL